MPRYPAPLNFVIQLAILRNNLLVVRPWPCALLPASQLAFSPVLLRCEPFYALITSSYHPSMAIRQSQVP